MILFPFLRQLETLSGRIIPEPPAAAKDNALTQGIERLEERFIAHPAVAIEQSRVAINAMAQRSLENLTAAFALLGAVALLGGALCVLLPEQRSR